MDTMDLIILKIISRSHLDCEKCTQLSIYKIQYCDFANCFLNLFPRKMDKFQTKFVACFKIIFNIIRIQLNIDIRPLLSGLSVYAKMYWIKYILVRASRDALVVQHTSKFLISYYIIVIVFMSRRFWKFEINIFLNF